MIGRNAHLNACLMQYAGGFIGFVPGLMFGTGSHAGTHNHRIGEFCQIICHRNRIGPMDQHHVQIILLRQTDCSADIVRTMGMDMDRHFFIQHQKHMLHASVCFKIAARCLGFLFAVTIVQRILQAFAELPCHAHTGSKAVFGTLGVLPQAALHSCIPAHQHPVRHRTSQPDH